MRSVVGVDSTGRRVVYTEFIWDPFWHRDPSGRSSDYIVVREGHHEIRKAVPGMLRFVVALCCGQQSLAVAERDGRIAIYDTHSLQVLRSGQVLPERFEVLDLTFSRNGRYVAVSGRDQTRSQLNAAASAQWPYMYVVVDANTLEVAQELGPREFFRESNGAPYRVVKRKSLSGGTPSFSEGQIMEFERGFLEPIASAPEPPNTSYSASLRFACDSSKWPQFVVWDRQHGTSRTMTTAQVRQRRVRGVPPRGCFRHANGTVPLGGTRGTGPCFRSKVGSQNASSRRKMDQSPSDPSTVTPELRITCQIHRAL